MNTLKTPFEGSVKRIADLEKLIATDSAVAITLDNGTNVLRVSDFFNSAGAKHRMFFVQAVLNFNTNKQKSQDSQNSLILTIESVDKHPVLNLKDFIVGKVGTNIDIYPVFVNTFLLIN